MTLVSGLVVVAAIFVTTTLRTPEVPSYPATIPDPVEVGERKVGPAVVTVDASTGEDWVFFDFSRGSVVDSPMPTREWDLAFRRYRIIVNGGPDFAGDGGVLPLTGAVFDSLVIVPKTGYVGSVLEGDPLNPTLERWYDYSWTSHLLEPKPTIYAIRTADGRFAKLQILGYYCPEARPGCLTFRYVYQGGGGTDVGVP